MLIITNGKKQFYCLRDLFYIRPYSLNKVYIYIQCLKDVYANQSEL